MERKIRNVTLAAALLALAATGCAGARAKAKVERVWPFPPDIARVKYVRSLRTDFDVASGARSFWTAIAGKKSLGLYNPTNVALSEDDRRLYVACSAIGQVLVFDFEKGTLEKAADQEGYRPQSPWGLAVDGAGNLYVGDQKARVVWVYSAGGKFLRKIGEGVLDRPVGIAIDRRRQILYVVDVATGESPRQRVEAFASDGRHLRTIGKIGTGPGEFSFPSYVAVAPDGNLYVADTSNFRIQVFDPEGTFVTMMGSIGEGPGLFGKVKGLAWDSFGNLYVADSQVGIVQMFNSKFQPLMFFGGISDTPGFMRIPNGIAIDSKNNIYVSDYGFNHVNQYALINTTAADSQGPSAPAEPPAAGTAPPPSSAAPSLPAEPQR